MNRMSRNVISLLVLALFVCTGQSVIAGEQAPDLSSTITVTATSMAAGIGWSWGSGTLTLLGGSQHQFKVGGLDVVAVGIKQATGVGNVYHLKRLADNGHLPKFLHNPVQAPHRIYLPALRAA